MYITVAQTIRQFNIQQEDHHQEHRRVQWIDHQVSTEEWRKYLYSGARNIGRDIQTEKFRAHAIKSRSSLKIV